MQTLPLLPESPIDSIVAWNGSHPVTRAEFLCHIRGVAAHLPPTGHVLNLCKSRYWFGVGLFAAISRGILSLMPNAVAPDLIAGLRAEFPDLLCLCDQADTHHGLPHLIVSDIRPAATPDEMPRIPAEQEALYVYTSGSTGQPRRHVKTFGRLCQCAEAEAGHVHAITGAPCAIVGTVPFQHMYGLESTVFLPLLGAGTLTSRLPFFPADVAAALAEVPAPRFLVTTPFHLRKLVEADIDFPPIAGIVSATAPLSAELAIQAETRLNASIMEIYGSTETGQIATRRTAREDTWRIYDGIEIDLQANGPVVTGGHLEGPQLLNDVIQIEGDGRFRLLGRNSDIVNVAGKRNSLASLNQILTHLPGVVDGVFCAPHAEQQQEIARLAAFVVAPALSAHDLQTALLQKIDPIFLPRPIVFLDALPRERSGKLTADAQADLMKRYLS
ncbi:MAG: AMP-binding protein [Desulfobulbus sp.]|nr:AMP-binding protein [Desulfobulbus sp.]